MEGFYVNLASWETSPLSTAVYGFQFDDAEEFDEEAGVPKVAADLGLRTLLVVSNLEDVVLDTLVSDSQARLEDYIEAVNYYREFDSFKPFKPRAG